MRRSFTDFVSAAVLVTVTAAAFQGVLFPKSAPPPAEPSAQTEIRPEREPLVPMIARPIGRTAPIECRDAFHAQVKPAKKAARKTRVAQAGLRSPFAKPTLVPEVSINYVNLRPGLRNPFAKPVL